MPGLPVAVLVLAFVHPSAAPPPAVGRDTLDRLLAEYRALGLPLPAAGTRIARYRGVGAMYLAPPDETPADLATRFGIRRHRGDIVPTAAVADEIVAAGRVTPELAVQCHALGWTAFALRLLSSPSAPSERVMVKALRETAFDHWRGRIDERGSDWKSIAARMQHLMNVEPSLEWPQHRELVREILRATEPTGAMPGSDQAFRDGLIEVDKRSDRYSRRVNVPFSQDSAYDRVIRRGFAAVPALIAALDDTRRTRSFRMPDGRDSGLHFEVRHLATQMLVEIAGTEPDGTPALSHERNEPLSRADASAWWAKACKVGEEKYAAGRALHKESAFPDHYQLAVLAERYPRHLTALYRETLKDGRKVHNVRTFAAAVLASSLSRREKLALFAEAAKSKDVSHRLAAASSLRVLDAAAWRSLVLREFREMPKDVEEHYRNAEVIEFAHHAASLEDRAGWEVFAATCRRAEVSMRMALLQEAGWAEVPTAACFKRRLEFLASFLGDADLRKIEAGAKRQWPYHKEYPILSVADYAALLLAKDLGINVAPDPKRKPAEWATLRDRVRKAVADELK